MVIDLDSFKIESYPLTDDWSNIRLVALDQNKKRVVIAVTSFATGALDRFPHATKEAKEKSLNNLAKYLKDNNIFSYVEWILRAEPYIKTQFALSFNYYVPNFVHL